MNATKVLVANRGEIACRIMRTLQELAIPSVALYTAEEREAPHVLMADESVALAGPADYVSIERVLRAAHQTGAEAIHPGYGFLSERPEFAHACREASVLFIGPSPAAMQMLGDKRTARRLAEREGVPVVPGVEVCDTAEAVHRLAADVGYPILLKAAAGGGGRGMRRLEDERGLEQSLVDAKREARAGFGDDRLLAEKYVYPARHVEVQVLGDGFDAMVLGERECSLQRRHQKLVEESPSPALDDDTRAAMKASARRLALAAKYAGAGTVEFLVAPGGEHYFLEVNTRLQVEHAVTEMRAGIDLVAAQLGVAFGEGLPAEPSLRGHAIEVRLNAEDPAAGFLPQAGRVLMLEWPHRPGFRVDAGIGVGSEIGVSFDPLLAKLIAWGDTREEARRHLVAALRETTLLGVQTNQSFLIDVLESEFFVRGETFTTTIESRVWEAPEPPPHVLAAASRALAGSKRSNGNGGNGDRYSPWQRLGGFRLGHGLD